MRFLLVSKSSLVAMIVVLQVKRLTVPKMIRLTRKKWDILDYLPEHKDCKLSNCQIEDFYEM